MRFLDSAVSLRSCESVECLMWESWKHASKPLLSVLHQYGNNFIVHIHHKIIWKRIQKKNNMFFVRFCLSYCIFFSSSQSVICGVIIAMLKLQTFCEIILWEIDRHNPQYTNYLQQKISIDGKRLFCILINGMTFTYTITSYSYVYIVCNRQLNKHTIRIIKSNYRFTWVKH